MANKLSDDEIRQQLLNDFLDKQDSYIEFTKYMENRILSILFENNLKYQAVMSRVKSYNSLKDKLTPNVMNGIRRNINNLNDLSGVRVIFYDDSNISKFKDCLKEEFKIIEYHLTKDIIQYNGDNITVELKNDNGKFSNFRCEVQVTTAIGHVLNELGHNILYKDIDNLKSIDSKTYDEIQKIYNDSRIKSIQIEQNSKNILQMVNGLKEGLQSYLELTNMEYIKNISSLENYNQIEQVISKMNNIIPIISNSEEKYEKIKKFQLVKLITERFVELPVEQNNNYYFGLDYNFKDLTKFLIIFRYLWLDDFEYIIDSLNKYALANDLLKDYHEFLKELLDSDRNDVAKDLSPFPLAECYYNAIMKNSINEETKIEMIEHFCDLNYSYCEEEENNKVNFISGRINPTDMYFEYMENVIEKLLEMYLSNRTERTLAAIKNINYEIEKYRLFGDRNTIYTFFDRQYDLIDAYSKFELYNASNLTEKSLLRKSSFYRKYNADEHQKLFAYLFSWHIWDEDDDKKIFDETKRREFLEKYVDEFTEENIADIIDIIDFIETNNAKKLNYINACAFLFNIGQKRSEAKEILKQKWNEYIELGAILSKKNSIKNISLKKKKKIINAMSLLRNYDKDLLTSLMDDQKLDISSKIDITVIIMSDKQYMKKPLSKKYFLNVLKESNENKQGWINRLLFLPEMLNCFVNTFTSKQIDMILTNLFYDEHSYESELFLKTVFEKYPQKVREYICKRMDDDCHFGRDKLNQYYNLSKCSNFDNELNNNLLIALDLVKKYGRFRCSQVSNYLIGSYSEKLEKVIIEYLYKHNTYSDYQLVLELCHSLETSTKAWNVYEYIISNVNKEDQLWDEIETLLYNTGVVWGEYGLLNSFKSKEQFLSKLKTSNDKVKAFLKKEKSNFAFWYKSEKNKCDKENIINSNNL